MQSQVNEALKQMEKGQKMMEKFSMPGGAPMVVSSESATLAVAKVIFVVSFIVMNMNC